jgi:hypothetical protein
MLLMVWLVSWMYVNQADDPATPIADVRIQLLRQQRFDKGVLACLAEQKKINSQLIDWLKTASKVRSHEQEAANGRDARRQHL